MAQLRLFFQNIMELKFSTFSRGLDGRQPRKPITVQHHINILHALLYLSLLRNHKDTLFATNAVICALSFLFLPPLQGN